MLVLGVARRRDQHVGGFDIAVHEAALMRRVQRERDGRQQRGGAPRVERAVVVQERAQVGALDVARGQEQDAVALTGFVHRQDVGMLDRRAEPGLSLEPRAERFVAGQVGRDHLERDETVERQLRGPVHDAHPAAPGHSLDPAAGELGPDGQVGHQRFIPRRDAAIDAR